MYASLKLKIVLLPLYQVVIKLSCVFSLLNGCACYIFIPTKVPDIYDFTIIRKLESKNGFQKIERAKYLPFQKQTNH